MPNTYVALRTETVAVATSSVTFSLSGILGYTDLRLVISAKDGSASTFGAAFLRFNSDSTSNYSFTNLYGDGTTAGSTRATSSTSGDILIAGSTASNFGISTVDIFNYSNATTFKTFISRGNTAESYTNARVGLWRKTPEAITSILITSGSGNFAVGSTFSLYGIANADQGAAKATGGIITEDSQYWYHTFGATGAFIPKQSLSCDVLVVAGGGGSGWGGGGGGGAGGLTYYASQSLTAISHNVTVGGGGAGGVNSGSPHGSKGTNSQFAALTASVGGGAGAGTSDANTTTLVNGGSGGGGNGRQGQFTGGTATSGQGQIGGNGVRVSPNANEPAGGGGGFSVAGTNGDSVVSGSGGNGSSTYSSWGIATGTGQNVSGTVWYAGGGAGGKWTGPSTGGAAGNGGGGAFTTNTSGGPGQAGLANTGGGASGGFGSSAAAAAGGSGVVIIRYSK